MGIDNRKDIDQGLENSVHWRLSFCVLPHSLEEDPFVASVREYKEVWVAVHCGQELLAGCGQAGSGG